MAELGQTTDVRQLIPGEPAAIDQNVLAIRGRGETMGLVGDTLKKINTDAWTGAAGDAFRDKFSYEPALVLYQGSDAFETAVAALDRYVDTVRWAQSQAAEAIQLWAYGEAATRQAISHYSGAKPKATDLGKYADAQGWTKTQTPDGPPKYVDENGTVRMTIKEGSPRAPGSGSPHVEIRDENGQRMDPYGNPVTRKSPANHTPIEWDF